MEKEIISLILEYGFKLVEAIKGIATAKGMSADEFDTCVANEVIRIKEKLKKVQDEEKANFEK